MPSEKIQRKYAQLQMLKQQMSALLEQKKAIDEKLEEITNTIEALEKLGEIEKGNEIWSPFGSGAFVNSDIKDTENVFFAVAAGLVIREKRGNVIKILEQQKKELELAERKLIQEAGKYSEHANSIEKELEMLVRKEQEKEK